MDQRIEQAAIAACRVFYPEAFARGQQWEQFPESTRDEMRQAATAVAVALASTECHAQVATIESIRYISGELLLQVADEVPQEWNAGDRVVIAVTATEG